MKIKRLLAYILFLSLIIAASSIWLNLIPNKSTKVLAAPNIKFLWRGPNLIKVSGDKISGEGAFNKQSESGGDVFYAGTITFSGYGNFGPQNNCKFAITVKKNNLSTDPNKSFIPGKIGYAQGLGASGGCDFAARDHFGNDFLISGATKDIEITEVVWRIPPGCPGAIVQGPPSPGTTCPDGSQPGGPAVQNNSGEQDCQGSNIGTGWIICPLITGVSDAIDKIQEFIQTTLETDPLLGSGSNPVIRSVWDSFKNIANGLFIIIFLITIFANTLSIGIDNYTIKKILPRLVAAVIFIQFSFLLSSLAVDATNVLGTGLDRLLQQIIPDTVFKAGGFGAGLAGIGILAIAAAALVAVAGAGAIAILLALISGFIAILGVFLTLAIRKIIILTLIVVSPIAFVAWVLPNTENLFKLWYKNFIKLLLMFPLIILIFAMSRLVANISFSQGATMVDGKLTLTKVSVGNLLIGFIAMIAPLFIIPATFRMAGGAMSAAAGFVAGLTSKTRGLTKSERAQGIKQRGSDRLTELGQQGRTAPRRLLGRALSGTGILNTRRNQLRRGAALARIRTEAEKVLQYADLDADGLEKVARGRLSRPSDKIAALGRLTKMRRLDKVADSKSFMYANGQQSTYDAYAGANAEDLVKLAPDLMPSDVGQPFQFNSADVTPEKLADYHPNFMERQTRLGGLDNLNPQIFNGVLTSPPLRNRMQAGSLGYAYRWAEGAGATANPTLSETIRKNVRITGTDDKGNPLGAFIINPSGKTPMEEEAAGPPFGPTTPPAPPFEPSPPVGSRTASSPPLRGGAVPSPQTFVAPAAGSEASVQISEPYQGREPLGEVGANIARVPISSLTTPPTPTPPTRSTFSEAELTAVTDSDFANRLGYVPNAGGGLTHTPSSASVNPAQRRANYDQAQKILSSPQGTAYLSPQKQQILRQIAQDGPGPIAELTAGPAAAGPDTSPPPTGTPHDTDAVGAVTVHPDGGVSTPASTEGVGPHGEVPPPPPPVPGTTVSPTDATAASNTSGTSAQSAPTRSGGLVSPNVTASTAAGSVLAGEIADIRRGQQAKSEAAKFKNIQEAEKRDERLIEKEKTQRVLKDKKARDEAIRQGALNRVFRRRRPKGGKIAENPEGKEDTK